MKVSQVLAFALALAPATMAFPHMLRDMGMDSLAQFEAAAKRGAIPRARTQGAAEKRSQITSIPFPSITVPGLPLPKAIDIPFLVSVGTEVIPDANHPFQNPVAGDQRGGCPGLNIMSNYGYMPRNGIVSAGDIIYACQQMLGYSLDLSMVLVALALRSGAMDVTTLKMSIGGTDSRTSGPLSLILGAAPGLFDYKAHNRYEIDGSMAYDDSYFHKNQPNAGGFFNGTRFKQMQDIADANGGLYNLNFHIQHRYETYQECIANNPTCTWNVVGELLFYGADTYTYLGMASTDPSTSQIGPPDSASVQSFFGAKPSGDSFVFTPEKLLPGPDGHWYRRSTPLTTAEIAEQIAATYLPHAVPFGSNNGKTTNSFTPSGDAPDIGANGAGAMCLILNEIQENDGIIGQRFGIAAAAVISMLQTLIAPAFQSLGCPAAS